MAVITVATKDGVIAEIVDLEGWDLSKPIAQTVLQQQILEAVKAADEMERQQPLRKVRRVR